MSHGFYSETWVDQCGEPFPFESYRKLFHLHHYTMSPAAIDFWQEYKKSQYVSASKRAEYIDRKIADIVRYAYEKVPYYRKLYDAHGVNVKSIRGQEDIERLPLIDKTTLTLGIGSLSAPEKAKVEADKLQIKTSGSTGARMSFTCDREQLDRRWAAWMRLFEWSGWKWGNKEFRFWFKHASTVKQPKVEAFDAFLSNRNFFEFDKLDDEELAFFVEEINRKKPYLITGYYEAIEAIAKYAFRHDLSMKVPAILPSTQTVSPSSRKFVEKVFRSKILDKYASAEFSGIAHQCDKGDLYHVQSENVFLEVLADGKHKKEGMGEAVITDLSNRSTPLIRYRVGDVVEASAKRCDCGLILPVIKRPLGRIKNLISIDGKFFTEFDLAELEFSLWKKGLIDRLKFVQTDPQTVHVLVSGMNDPAAVKDAIKKFSGKGLPVLAVDSINHFRGKRHRGESKIANPFNN